MKHLLPILLAAFSLVQAEENIALIKAAISQEMASLFHHSCIITKAQDEGHGGRSGDEIFFIKDQNNQIVAVVKALVTSKRDRQFETQLSGINTLLKLNLEGTEPIHCLASRRGKNFHVLVLSPAPGQVQEQLFKQLANDRSVLEDMKEAFYAVGQVHARLHVYQQTPVEEIHPEILTQFTEIWKEASGYLTDNPDFPGIDFKQIEDNLLEVYQAFLRNPGHHCYTHGDPHPGNWFYNNANKKVTLIDLGHLRSNGYAAEELWRAQSCIAHMSVRYQVDETICRELQQSFFNGYFSIADRNYTTLEADHFFQTYWGMVNMRDALKRDSCKYANYINGVLKNISDKNFLYRY